MSRQHGSLVAVVWHDKRPVHILSTLSQPEETQTVSRRERDGSVVDVSVPSAILTYTKYMGGVNLGDQLRKYYSVCLKCVKNYKYFFWFLFDVCITNAFILSKLCNRSHISHDAGRLKAFRVSLAKFDRLIQQPSKSWMSQHCCHSAAYIGSNSLSLSPSPY